MRGEMKAKSEGRRVTEGVTGRKSGGDTAVFVLDSGL